MNLTNTFVDTMNLNADAIGDFCEMEPCQLFQLSPERTLASLNTMPEASRQALHKGLCDCELNARREYVGAGPQLAAAGVAIGGFILCPFTFGAGCAVGSVSSIALTGMGAVNTYGAIQDGLQYNPVLSVAQHLPGLTDAEREQIETAALDANGRIMIGAAEIALGVPAAVGEARLAREVFTDPSNFIPNHRSLVVESSALREATERTARELEGLPGEFSPSDVRTVMGRAHEYRWHGQRVNPNADGTLDFGTTFRIDEVPPPRSRGGYSTPFMEHPEFAATLERIRAQGYDVVIDPTRGFYGAGAYHSSLDRVIGMGPRSSWGTFIHELQHLEFSSVVRQRWPSLEQAVYREGRSVREVLTQQQLELLGETRVGRLEELLRRGHTYSGIDETLSVDAELRALGWRRWIPIGDGYSSARYAANHRANSLASLGDLTETQRRELFRSRLAAAGNFTGTGPGVLTYGGAATAGLYAFIGYDILINEQTGQMLFIDENGRTYSLSQDTIWDYCLGDDGPRSPELAVRRLQSGHCEVEFRND